MIGWIGSVLLAFCGLPQTIKSVRDGHSQGLSLLFILMWFFGEVFTLAAVASSLRAPYLLFNYSANILFLLIIVYYRFLPRAEVLL